MLHLSDGDVFAGNYQLTRMIDSGGFAEVWEARYRITGDDVALKIYPRLDEEGIAILEAEYRRLFRLQHTYLVKALYFDRQEGYPYLVMVYYEGGNASRRIGSYTENDIARCLYQTGSALGYLHMRSIVHCDIKPNNFLLDADGNFILTDLGLSAKVQHTIRMSTRPADGGQRERTAGITPPQYRAPELWSNPSRGQEAKPAADIWAMGASIYEMITTDLPFGDLGGRMQMVDPYIRPLPGGWSAELNAILIKCLSKEQPERPSAALLEKWSDRYLKTGEWLTAEERKEVMGEAQEKDIDQGGEEGGQEQKRKGGTLRVMVVSGVVLVVLVVVFLRFFQPVKPAQPAVHPTSDTVAAALKTIADSSGVKQSVAKKDTVVRTPPVVAHRKKAAPAQTEKNGLPKLDKDKKW